jgi:hypothetical protein
MVLATGDGQWDGCLVTNTFIYSPSGVQQGYQVLRIFPWTAPVGRIFCTFSDVNDSVSPRRCVCSTDNDQIKGIETFGTAPKMVYSHYL